ncbi:MAG TPA: MBL fold metallo-hydrolase [Tepidiformaceae bacterium]|jgi:glyoxylase-like metal-dependent hydrolase (beta-lactamase superfamily II)|nr:MBL fold metallo-hydrolase [Tepidiformaceae bacterium]
MKRTTVGNVEITALVDTIEAYPASTVYPNADLSRYTRHLDAEGRVPLNFGSFLVRDGALLLLVDTGWGPEHNGRLLAELAEAGVKPSQVTHILFTHLHGDHTGWNLDRATGKVRFPGARFLVPKLDWDHYLANPNASFERDVRPLEALGVMELVEGERALSAALTAIPTPGHTPGHTSLVITSGQERGFILGDVVISAVDAEDPEMDSVFDWDSGVARETRRKTVERLIADGSIVGASHLPAPGLGRFVREGRRQWWQAL